MVSALIARVVMLVFGTMYPAYCSYKAVRNRDVKEYVKWMMYWIVYAVFTTLETFTDLLLSWVPFYYELKIVFIIWLLSPSTRGSTILYKRFIHAELMKHEQEIDRTLDRVKARSYPTLLKVGTHGLSMAIQGAFLGQAKIMDHLKKNYRVEDMITHSSIEDITSAPVTMDTNDETDFVTQCTSRDVMSPEASNTASQPQTADQAVPSTSLTADIRPRRVRKSTLASSQLKVNTGSEKIVQSKVGQSKTTKRRMNPSTDGKDKKMEDGTKPTLRKRSMSTGRRRSRSRGRVSQKTAASQQNHVQN